MRSHHHVLDLLRSVLQGWKYALPQFLDEGGRWYVSFADSAFRGMKLSLLRPVLRFSDEECSPMWRSGAIPYAHSKKEDVAWKEQRASLSESIDSASDKNSAGAENSGNVRNTQKGPEKGGAVASKVKKAPAPELGCY